MDPPGRRAALTDPSEGTSHNRWAGWIVLSTILAALPALVFRFLPMTDLPQHAAQLAGWMALSDPGSPLHAWLEVDWRTPSLVMMSVARGLASVLPVRLALNVVVAAAVAGLPLACWFMLRAAGRPPAWALLCTFLGLGYSFHWGFLAFLLAAPLALVVIGSAEGWGKNGGRTAAITAVLLGTFLFFCHALVYGFALAAAGPLLLRSAPTLRLGLRRALPLLAPLPWGLLWVAWTWLSEPIAAEPPEWLPEWSRISHMVLALAGQPASVSGAAIGLSYLVAPFLLLGATWPRDRLRLWPVVLALLLAALGPSVLLGCAWLPGRWTAFIVPLLLFAVEPGTPVAVQRRMGPLAALLLVLGHGGLIAQRFHRFDQEARAFEPLLAVMEPGERVLSIPLESAGHDLLSAPFLHFPQWYAATGGGIVDFSFSSYYVLLVRYRDGQRPPIEAGFPWRPVPFVKRVRTLAPFRYYVVQSQTDPTGLLFPRGDVRRLLHSGRFWLYEPLRP